MLVKRSWWISNGLQVEEFIQTVPGEKTIASLKWMCCTCGHSYAECVVTHDRVQQKFSFIHGCCASCKGNQHYVPASLECMTLVDWKVPKEILDYQLYIEMNFLHHPSHPHNQGDF